MRRRALAAGVDTVAALVLANGATLAVGARHERFSQEAQILAHADAFAFTAIDTIFVLRRRIRLVYLADAAVEHRYV